MITRILAVFFFCFTITVFGQGKEFEKYIELNKSIFPRFNYCYKSDSLNFQSAPFNDAPEIGLFMAYLKCKYKIDTAIETGTYFTGSTTIFLGSLFEEVHTIEYNLDFYISAKKVLEPYRNVHCHYGSSDDVLREILPGLKEKPIIFYLDAHGYIEYWPLLHELYEISCTHKDNCIVVIDDFKVPGRSDIDYDRYGNDECSYEYIKDHLHMIFTNPETHYLIPKALRAKAKFLALPKHWELSMDQMIR